MFTTEITTDLVGLIGCASRLGIPPKWLKDMAIEGEVPCLRISERRFLFNVEAVRLALLAMAAERAKPRTQVEAS